jgi:hypothetical protein
MRALLLTGILATVLAFGGSNPLAAPRAIGDPQSGGSQRRNLAQMAEELERQATVIARDSYDHFKGSNNAITDQEQAILFKSEEFAASCRLFVRLAGGQTEFYREEHLRTSLFNAFTYLTRSFSELEREMRQGNVMPYAMSDARRLLSRMEREFSGWAAPDNLAYLDGKYVQGADASIYLIERRGMGEYTRRPFGNLESLFRYNYDQNRGNDPWKFRVQVPEDTLRRMRTGPPITVTFEGQMVMEAGNGRNRPVFRIENGKKRPFARPDLLNRYGGWAKVFEVPREVITSYPDGEPIDRRP